MSTNFSSISDNQAKFVFAVCKLYKRQTVGKSILVNTQETINDLYEAFLALYNENNAEKPFDAIVTVIDIAVPHEMISAVLTAMDCKNLSDLKRLAFQFKESRSLQQSGSYTRLFSD